MTETTDILRLERVARQYSRTDTPAVAGVSLSVPDGMLLALLGPSGCGKTTLLRLVAGFERPQQGRIFIGDRCVAGNGDWVPPERRDVGMVFQDYALFPHLSAAKNVAFGLSRAALNLDRSRRQQRVRAMLALVGLEGYEERYPHELSGGQQQRVALARALAPEPAMILLDEPLSNLDAQVRLRLRQELRDILKQAGTAAIFVTHDREEALSMADRLGVMADGRLQQLGTPEAVYRHPATRFVAEFVAQGNLLPARRHHRAWETELGSHVLSAEQTSGSFPEADSGEIAIPPDALALVPDATGPAVIRDRHFLGREYRYRLQLPSGREVVARTPSDGAALSAGDRVRLELDPQRLQWFPVGERPPARSLEPVRHP